MPLAVTEANKNVVTPPRLRKSNGEISLSAEGDNGKKSYLHWVRNGEEDSRNLAEYTEDDQEDSTDDAGSSVRASGEGDDTVVLRKDRHRCDREHSRPMGSIMSDCDPG
jgi:hypothetical protein